MKFWRLFFCITFVFSINSAIGAPSLEAFCQSNVAANIMRARWGFDLRKEMLQKCEGQNLRICSQPYTDLLTRQERLDLAELQQQFDTTSPSPKARFLMQASVKQKTEAAFMALREAADTPEAVAQEIFAQCIRQESRDLDAAAQNGTLSRPQSFPCVGGGGLDYLQGCCTPDCQCDVNCP